MEAGTRGEIRGSAGSKAMAGHREKMRRAFIPRLPSQDTDSHPPASASVVAICKLSPGISRALESPDSAGGVGLEAAALGDRGGSREPCLGEWDRQPGKGGMKRGRRARHREGKC